MALICIPTSAKPSLSKLYNIISIFNQQRFKYLKQKCSPPFLFSMMAFRVHFPSHNLAVSALCFYVSFIFIAHVLVQSRELA